MQAVKRQLHSLDSNFWISHPELCCLYAGVNVYEIGTILPNYNFQNLHKIYIHIEDNIDNVENVHKHIMKLGEFKESRYFLNL
jgi:hypothetical protein